MISLLEEQLERVRAACRRHEVLRLEVFGSAADQERFDPRHSDIDFIVSFASGSDLGPWMRTYFDLREELQNVLARPVELVMESAIRDPLFRREADRTRELIYAVAKPEAA
jgi:uncharacterized protein